MNGSPLTSFHVLVMGLCAMCAQAVFVRETMALFTGTEFVIGVVLAAWLLWVGIGGLVGGWLVRRKRLERYADFARLGTAAALLLPLTVVGIRFGRGVLSQPPGSFPPVSHAILFSVSVILPFCIVYGAIYNTASLLWSGGERGLRRSVSLVYIWEAVGTLGGALLFSFVLVSRLSHLGAAAAAALFTIAVLMSGGGLRIPVYARIVILAVLVSIAVALIPRADAWTLHRIFPGYSIEGCRTSPYGEVVAASRAEMLSYYQGGGRLFSIPEPERTEEIVHIPMLLHPAPRAVLLIGGSLGGGWQETIEHPTVETVDCLELDGDLLAMALELEGSRIGRYEKAGREIDFIATDGRRYLSTGGRRYDVIILDAPPPLNLQWNRYYTVEFFSRVRESLAEGGLFGFIHPSSENFLSDAQATVLATLRATMGEVFDEVLVLPGSVCHFVGSEHPLETGLILERLRDRDIEAVFVGEGFLPYRFSEERIAALQSGIDIGAAVPNSDSRPFLPVLEIVLEGERSGSRVLSVVARLAGLPPLLPTGLIGAVLLLLFCVGRRVGAPYMAIGAVGLGSFLLQLLVLLSFQAYAGVLYRAIVMLTATFMTGAALGAFVSMRKGKVGRMGLYTVHGGFILLSLLLLGLHAIASRISAPYVVESGIYFLFSASGGILTGAYYPLVVRTALPEGKGSIPARYYAWDLLGACVGGCIGGMFLFPFVGLAGTVLFITGIHVAAMVMLVGRW